MIYAILVCVTAIAAHAQMGCYVQRDERSMELITYDTAETCDARALELNKTANFSPQNYAHADLFLGYTCVQRPDTGWSAR